MAVIKNIRIFDGEEFLPMTAMRYEDGVIRELYDIFTGEAVDGGSMILSPGYVDLHTHGIAGYDVMDRGALKGIVDVYPRYGVTSICPGAVAAPDGDIRLFLEAVRESMRSSHGANVLGAYLEGPYLSARCKGAIDEKMMREPSVADYERMTGEYGDVVARVTMALEMAGSMELVERLARWGVVVSVGHSAASAAQVRQAAGLGLNSTTHTFNGMLPMHHREPGVVGAALTDDRIFAEFIADMIHVDPVAVRLIYLAKGADGCYFCTDSMSATGMADGAYRLHKTAVTVKDGIATSGGSLAGSTLTMDKGLRNLVRTAGIPLEHALQMGTLNPARVMGISDRKGRIAPGYDADFILLDGDLAVRMTVVKGRTEYCCQGLLT